MDSRLATFTVAASVEQGAVWKRAAELAGHLSIGTWLAEAADAHAQPKPRAKIFMPASSRVPGHSGRCPSGTGVTVTRSGSTVRAKSWARRA